MNFLSRLVSGLRVTGARAGGADIAPSCAFAPGVRLQRGVRDGHPGIIALGAGCQLEDGVILWAWGGKIALGTNVFLGPYAVIYGHGGVEIGDNTLVSMHCRILSSNHSVPVHGTPIRSQPDVLLPTQIGHDLCLGAGITVLDGVRIRVGCVV